MKFNKALRGYDIEEVNKYFDGVIEKVENIVKESKQKDEEIARYKKMESEFITLQNRLSQYERMEEQLKRAILMAERTSEQIKLTSHQERDIILSDAKNNANRIINEALLRAEKISREADCVKRNTNLFKNKLRDIIKTQLDLVDDIEKIEV